MGADAHYAQRSRLDLGRASCTSAGFVPQIEQRGQCERLAKKRSAS